MYYNRCHYCLSECFCNCHQLRLNQSNDYTYQMEPSYYSKYETAKFHSTYSNGYEGDTMPSFSEKWKHSQPLKLNQYNSDDSLTKEQGNKGILNEGFASYGAFRANEPQCQERPDLDELIKGNGRLIREMPMEGDDSMHRRSFSQSFSKKVNGEKKPIDEENEQSEGGSRFKEALDEALGFVKLVASKERVHYVDDEFYIRNSPSLKQLIEILKRRLYEKPVTEGHLVEEHNRNQFEKAVNVIQSEKMPITSKSDNQFRAVPQQPKAYDIPVQRKEQVPYKVQLPSSSLQKEPIQGSQLNKDPIPVNHLSKAPRQDNRVNKELNQINQLNQWNKKPTDGKQISKNPEQEYPIKKEPLSQQHMNHLSMPHNPKEANPKTNLAPVNKSINPTAKANNNPKRNVKPKEQPKDNITNKPQDIPRNKSQQASNTKPISDSNNNQIQMANPPRPKAEDIYYHQSFKDKPHQDLLKEQPVTLKKQQGEDPTVPSKPQNQNRMYSSYSQNNIFPIYNSNAPNQNKPKPYQANKSNPQVAHSKHLSEVNATASPLHQRYTNSPLRDCFACNVQCNISSTGYSPMTYSPYGDRKKRRSITPLKNCY